MQEDYVLRRQAQHMKAVTGSHFVLSLVRLAPASECAILCSQSAVAHPVPVRASVGPLSLPTIFMVINSRTLLQPRTIHRQLVSIVVPEDLCLYLATPAVDPFDVPQMTDRDRQETCVRGNCANLVDEEFVYAPLSNRGQSI